MQKEQRVKLMDILQEICQASIGSPIIYTMIETIQSFLEELVEHNTPLKSEMDGISIDNDHQHDPGPKLTYSVPSVHDHLIACGRRLPISVGVKCPKIYHGETIADRKSIFQVVSY